MTGGALYLALADSLLVVHFAFVAFVVVGFILILAGLWCGWKWVRNFWFRIFLGWLIRLAGLRLGGVRAIRNRLQPYMIGLILGSVVAVLLWDAVAIYRVVYGYTGQVYITW